MSSKNDALEDWEVDFFWRRAVDRWEREQDTSPEVDLLRAETERLVTQEVRAVFLIVQDPYEK